MDDREKLIEAVGSFKFPIESGGCTIGEYIVPYSIQEKLVDHLIANGATIQKWIPVTERLPEDDENIHFYDDGRLRCVTVLAYTEYGRTIPKNRLLVRPTGIEYLDTQVTDGWVWASGTEEVTHWMPLPEPPKGE